MRYAPITDRLAGLGAEKWHVHFRAREKALRGDNVLFLSIGWSAGSVGISRLLNRTHPVDLAGVGFVLIITADASGIF